MADPYDALVPLPDPNAGARTIGRGLVGAGNAVFAEPVMQAFQALRGRMSERELQDFIYDAAVGVLPAAKGVKAARGLAKAVGPAISRIPEGHAAEVFGRTAGKVPIPWLTEAGDAIKGGAFSKASRGALDEIGAMPKGSGPLDLSLADQRLVVPQRALERYQPARGVSPRLLQAMDDPQVIKGILESMEAGRGFGADKWYHTQPIYQAFVDRLGPEQGPRKFAEYMDMVAATSPRSDVPTNLRNASFMYSLQGGPLPASQPYPYGHVAQNLHRQNYETVMGRGGAAGADVVPGWDVMQNPKPASFSQNLQGNLVPVTVDTHAFRNIGMRTNDPRFLETAISEKYKPGKDPSTDSLVARYGEPGRQEGTVIFRPQQLLKAGKLDLDEAKSIPKFWASKPNENEYGAAEQFYSGLGARQGLTPADAQAAAWAGAGELTGLGTVANKTFPEMMNERIMYTAKIRGEDPTKVLDDLVHQRRPLLGIGAVGAGGAIGAGAMSGGNSPWDALPPGQF